MVIIRNPHNPILMIKAPTLSQDFGMRVFVGKSRLLGPWGLRVPG